MNRLLTLSFAVAALFFATASFAQISDREQNHIEVSTRVEEQITPDIIYLAITIDEQNSKTLLEAKEREMIKALQSLGIDIKEALTVNDMSSDLKKYFLKKDNVTAKKSYTLKLKPHERTYTMYSKTNRQSDATKHCFRHQSPKFRRRTKQSIESRYQYRRDDEPTSGLSVSTG